jgi:uncharacterized protein (TIGR02246 family)
MDGARPVSFEIYRDAIGVLHRYCRAIDTHDAAALALLLHDDVVLTVNPDRWEGQPAVMVMLTGMFEQRAWARHFVSNIEVSGLRDGDVGVRAYAAFILSSADRIIGAGDYFVTIRRTDDGLRIAQLELAMLDVAAVRR